MHIFLNQKFLYQPNKNFGNKTTTLTTTKNLTKAQIKRNKRNSIILKMVEKGFSFTEISKMLSISIKTIRELLKHPKDLNYAEQTVTKVLERIKRGETIEFIMQEENLPKNIIINIASKSMLKVLTNFQKNKKERDSLIKTMILKGMTVENIAKELGISPTLVKNISKRNKINKEYKKQQLLDIVERIKLGKSCEEIAQENNVDIKIIQKLVNQGVKQGLIENKKNKQKERIIEFIKSGKSIEQIIQKEQVSRRKVEYIASGAGLKVFSESRKKRDQRNKDILNLLMNGISRTQVAKQLGIETSIVTKIAEANNVFQTLIEQRALRIIEKIKQGLSFSKIASEENINETTVVRIANKYGVSQLHKEITNKIKENRKASIIKDIKNGMNIVEIAEKYGTSTASITKIKRENGLTKKYNFLQKPQIFKYIEIQSQSRKISKLRETYSKFKHGERTPEIIQEMLEILDNLKINLEEFNARFK